MIQTKCIQKFRDNTGKIYGYRLADSNGQIKDVRSEELKNAIRCKHISVVNLTLTSDSRLVDTSEKSSHQASETKDLNNETVQKLQAYLSNAFWNKSEYIGSSNGKIKFRISAYNRVIDCCMSDGKLTFYINDRRTTGHYPCTICCEGIISELTFRTARDYCAKTIDSLNICTEDEEHKVNKQIIIKNSIVLKGGDSDNLREIKSLMNKMAVAIFKGYGLNAEQLRIAYNENSKNVIDQYFELGDTIIKFDGVNVMLEIGYNMDYRTMWIRIDNADTEKGIKLEIRPFSIYNVSKIKQTIIDFVNMTKSHISK